MNIFKLIIVKFFYSYLLRELQMNNDNNVLLTAKLAPFDFSDLKNLKGSCCCCSLPGGGLQMIFIRLHSKAAATADDGYWINIFNDKGPPRNIANVDNLCLFSMAQQTQSDCFLRLPLFNETHAFLYLQLCSDNAD